jgi:tRNA(Arg) A34 adenosine deaminase TadA
LPPWVLQTTPVTKINGACNFFDCLFFKFLLPPFLISFSFTFYPLFFIHKKHPMSNTPLDEVPLGENDAKYLRQAIALSHRARAGNNRPFGAVIISKEGQLLSEGYNNSTETGDVTGHAETTAVRNLSGKFDRSVLQEATLYASGEPCVMCSGSIFLSGISRVVFGIDAVRLRVFRGDHAVSKDLELSCRDIFKSSPHPIECIGPALLEEASKAHIGFWP